MYWLVLLDDYSASFGLMVVVITTCLAVTRVYGEKCIGGSPDSPWWEPGGRGGSPLQQPCTCMPGPEVCLVAEGLHWSRGHSGVGHSSSSLPRAGIQRFCRDIHMMLGFKPGLYFRACWLFLSPATLLVTTVGGRGAPRGLGLRAGVLLRPQHSDLLPLSNTPGFAALLGW